MRIIFSRKGFDSANGGVASPIFPSGELRSLPIPEPQPARLATPIRYGQIGMLGQPLEGIVSDLCSDKVNGIDAAHLDPDLDPQSLPRQAGWRPVFGQTGAAETHLRNQGVQPGDVFLYFGWFRRVEQHAGHYRYVSGAPDLHVIFGWLQIERRIDLRSRANLPLWALYHPHSQVVDPAPNESLYISTSRLDLPGLKANVPGGGIFSNFAPELCLTDRGQTLRSKWRLPGWIYPSDGKPALSFHDDPQVWDRDGSDVLLSTAGRGQEFVLDCDHYPQAIPWLTNLLTS